MSLGFNSALVFSALGSLGRFSRVSEQLSPTHASWLQAIKDYVPVAKAALLPALVEAGLRAGGAGCTCMQPDSCTTLLGEICSPSVTLVRREAQRACACEPAARHSQGQDLL